MKKILFIVILISFLGCTEKKETVDIEEIEISPVKKIAEINDSTFLSLVMNISEKDGIIYFTDNKNNRIVCVDENYNLVKCFGTTGKGPADFNFPGKVEFDNNLMYVMDEDNMKINVYDLSAKFIENITGTIPRFGSFIVNDSVYFGSKDDYNNPLFMASLEGKMIKEFGNNNRTVENVNQNMPKNYLLEKWQNQLVAICESDPVIERYTMDGELLDLYDYSNLKYWEPVIAFIEKKQKEDLIAGIKGTSMFCLDSYINVDKLYLLIIGYDKTNNMTEANRILILSLTKDKIVPEKILSLDNEAWYYAICVAGNKLIAFDNIACEIHEYRLD